MNEKKKYLIYHAGLHAIFGREIHQIATPKESPHGTHLFELTIINTTKIIISSCFRRSISICTWN